MKISCIDSRDRTKFIILITLFDVVFLLRITSRVTSHINKTNLSSVNRMRSHLWHHSYEEADESHRTAEDAVMTETDDDCKKPKGGWKEVQWNIRHQGSPSWMTWSHMLSCICIIVSVPLSERLFIEGHQLRAVITDRLHQVSDWIWKEVRFQLPHGDVV